MSVNGLKCPQCGNEEMDVIESRMDTDGTRRRVRMCMKCRARLVTHEIADDDLRSHRERRANAIIRKVRDVLIRALAILDEAGADGAGSQNKQN